MNSVSFFGRYTANGIHIHFVDANKLIKHLVFERFVLIFAAIFVNSSSKSG
jgi:hypothetical protein